MWKNRLKSESKALTYHYFLPSCTEPDKQALKYLLEKRGGNRRKREKRKMTYVNNMFFIKDLAFWSHRHNIQYKIHISCKMALMKWKPTAGIFLWSRLCEINTFWRSLSNSILNFISQSLIDEIYHHFHWTLFSLWNNKERSAPRREEWITWYRTSISHLSGAYLSGLPDV